MNNNKKKRNLLKKKLAILTALSIMSSTKVEAGMGFNILVEGEPKYSKELINEFDNLPIGLQQFILDYNTILLLEDDEEADDIFELYNGFRWPEDINSYNVWNRDKNVLFIEACKQNSCSSEYSEYSEILSKEEFDYRIVREAFFHELGHAIDGDNYEISTNDYFTEIYATESDVFMLTESFYVDNLQNKANIENQIEYFATAFSSYINHPEELFVRCPGTYMYIDEYVKEISSYYEKNITI